MHSDIMDNGTLRHTHWKYATLKRPDDRQSVLPVSYSSDVLSDDRSEMCSNGYDAVRRYFSDASHLHAALPDNGLPASADARRTEWQETHKFHFHTGG